ncbi:hypothetical protein [Kibdelosporangium philippinense]|uniref:hypothetical protein n=1 Tax=Kibdelosporangium philippinense TaxID=211113 RepID=UPI00361FC3CB
MSTVAAHRVHRSDTMKSQCQARQGHFTVPEWSTRHAGVVDTPFRNGGHGLQERWTR